MTGEQFKAIIQMLATLAVTVASIFGYTLADDMATSIAIVVAACLLIGASVWKNANFTTAAGLGQAITTGIKDGSISKSAVEAFIGVPDCGVAQDGKGDENDC